MLDESFEWFDLVWPTLAALLNFALAAGCTLHIVLRKRDVRAAIGWTGLVWLAPLLGSLLYFCFGINRIQRRATALQVAKFWDARSKLTLTEGEVLAEEDFAAAHPNLLGLALLGRQLTGGATVPGNRIDSLLDGDQTFPAMLQAIDRAAISISLLSYIFDSDRVGDKFLESLRRAQERGVEVRILIDDVGSRYSRHNMVSRLRAAGLQTVAFLPTRVPWKLMYANLRNHRKILVIDGKVGFTGGTNIREGHWLGMRPKFPVQCLHFRIEGPVVAHMQRMFAIDWAFASGESLQDAMWFPEMARVGPVWARGIPDGPDEDFEKLTDLIMGALSAASRTVRIVTPYFLPDTTLVRALYTAAMRGVDVQIVLPEHNNIAVVAWASTALFSDLLEKGCRIFLTPPPFDHTKLFVVDGVWSLIGSTNWDPRSLRLNFEFNIECFDDELGARLNQLVEQKIVAGREITATDIEQLSLPVQVRNGLARLASPYL